MSALPSIWNGVRALRASVRGEGRGGKRGCAQLEGRRRKRTFTGKRKRESGRGGCEVEKWSLIHVGEGETKTETERERDR